MPQAKTSAKRRTAYSLTGLTRPAFGQRSFYLPTPLIELIDKAATKRDDNNKSAVVSEALAEYFGVEVESGGDPIQAA